MSSHRHEASTNHHRCLSIQHNINASKQLRRRKRKRLHISDMTKDKNNNQTNNNIKWRSLRSFMFLVLSLFLMQPICVAEMIQASTATIATVKQTSVNSEKNRGSLVNSTAIVNSAKNEIEQNHTKMRRKVETEDSSTPLPTGKSNQHLPKTPVVKQKFRRKYVANNTHNHHHHQHKIFYKVKRRRYQTDMLLLSTPPPTIPKTTIQHQRQFHMQRHYHQQQQHFAQDASGRTFLQVQQQQQQHQPQIPQKQIASLPTATAAVTVQWQKKQEYVHQQYQPTNITHPHLKQSDHIAENRQNHVLVQGNTDIVLYRNMVGPLPCPPGVRLVPHRIVPIFSQIPPNPRPRGKNCTCLFNGALCTSLKFENEKNKIKTTFTLYSKNNYSQTD